MYINNNFKLVRLIFNKQISQCCINKQILFYCNNQENIINVIISKKAHEKIAPTKNDTWHITNISLK